MRTGATSKTRSEKSGPPASAEAARRSAAALESPGFHFVTVLPDGREVGMEDLAGCREVALRVELLSRGLAGRSMERPGL